MLRTGSISCLVGTLLCVSLFVIVLEWRAVHDIHRGLLNEPGHGISSLTHAIKIKYGSDSLRGSATDDGGAAGKGAWSGWAAAARQLVSAGAYSEEAYLKLNVTFPTPPEIRHRSCISAKFDVKSLPTITMVIPYLHEVWEQIEKTVAAVLTYTPPELLDEILFIDDGNTLAWEFHENLTAMHPKIRVHRNEERQGLIKAKVTGADLVKSPVIFFMEPHCIVGRHWLEPLLVQLTQSANHSTIVMPTLDIIPEYDFNDYRTANYHIGGFDWSLTFNWMTLIRDRNKSWSLPEPYPTPALSGGVFGIWKDFWNHMGAYDSAMTEWGGEHIEMSLRTWRCGGRIEIVPCSHIGHVFRSKNPYEVHIHEVLRNLKRAAKVWLDEYEYKFYAEVPRASSIEAGDVSSRIALKKSLNCHSMDWYLDNIYPELRHKQPRRR